MSWDSHSNFTSNFYGPKLIESIKKASPYPAKVTDQLVERTNLMASAMVRGQLVIAATIAAFSAALLIPLGFGSYYFVLLIIFTVLNFIPLGSGIVFVPLVVIQMVSGHFWLGLVLIGLHYAFGNIDPIMRARFVPKSINLSSGWTIVSTFCGIAYFGIIGVVYGPILFIILVSLWQAYLEYSQGVATKSKRRTA